MISFELLQVYAKKCGYSLVKSNNGFVLTNNLTKREHTYRKIKNISDRVIEQICIDRENGRRMIFNYLDVELF